MDSNPVMQLCHFSVQLDGNSGDLHVPLPTIRFSILLCDCFECCLAMTLPVGRQIKCEFDMWSCVGLWYFGSKSLFAIEALLNLWVDVGLQNASGVFVDVTHTWLLLSRKGGGSTRRRYTRTSFCPIP